MTRTYTILEVSEAAHLEISKLLRAVGYEHAFVDDSTIDMDGLALRPMHYDERKLPDQAEQQLRVQLEAWAAKMAREVIGPRVPAGVGFVFVAADFGRGGNIAYCSSVERPDALRLLSGLVDKWGSESDKCRRCSECQGEAHHWLEPEHFARVGSEDDDGIIVQRCKHCPAFRPDSEEL